MQLAFHSSYVTSTNTRATYFDYRKYNKNKLGNLSITSNCGTFAKYLYLLGYSNSLIPFHSKTMLLWRQNVVNNETYLGLHVMCPVFLSYFNVICSFLANFHSPHNQILSKYFQWDPRWCMRTNRKTWSEKVIFEKKRKTSTMKHTAVHSAILVRGSERCHCVTLIMKANKMHYFSNLFDKILYMFWTSPLSIIRSISTLYTRNKYLSS